MFRKRPELMEFKKASNRRSDREEKSSATGEPPSRPINHCYKDKTGTTFGLYQRFYWDASNVPFGGTPNFQR